MKNLIHLNNKNILLIFISIFFFTQLNFIYKWGTTYGADGLRFGSSLVIEKIKRILNLNFNFLQIEDFSRSTFYVTTFHRPRYLDDSCKFTINNIRYSCKSIYVLKKRIRLDEIPLAYINECRI